MQRIAIFGGTFNPVHSEHVQICVNAIKELNLDKLFVMPTFISPHKSLAPASAQDRLNMLSLAFSGVEKIEVSDFEIVNGGKSYTYLTVEHFKKQYNCQLFFIVGGDMLKDFKNWKEPKRILSACTLCAFNRTDCDGQFDKEKEYFKKTFNSEFLTLKYIPHPYSSTEIRINSSLNLDISAWVGEKVEKYIKTKALYQGGKEERFIIENLPKKRVVHTANVMTCALKKAKELNLDLQKVYLSALLHDCAKYLDYTAFKGFKLPCDIPEPVIHAFLGAFVAENILGVKDNEVLDAICYHTSGKANMSTLGKLIFVADMVEKERVYEGVETLRNLFNQNDFEYCFRECLKEEFIHLINKGSSIYQETVNAYDYYIKENK